MDNKTKEAQFAKRIEGLEKQWEKLRDKRERWATRIGGIENKMQAIKDKIATLKWLRE